MSSKNTRMRQEIDEREKKRRTDFMAAVQEVEKQHGYLIVPHTFIITSNCVEAPETSITTST